MCFFYSISGDFSVPFVVPVTKLSLFSEVFLFLLFLRTPLLSLKKWFRHFNWNSTSQNVLHWYRTYYHLEIRWNHKFTSCKYQLKLPSPSRFIYLFIYLFIYYLKFCCRDLQLDLRICNLRHNPTWCLFGSVLVNLCFRHNLYCAG